MADCNSLLIQVVREIEPTKSQKNRASISHNNLRGLLSDGRFGNRLIDTYLSGSYERSTAIAPLEDVDIIFLIDPSHWKAPFLSSRPSPEHLIASFAGAVKNRYPDSRVIRQRRSVCLSLNHISLDIVPAIPVDPSGTIIEIPDRNQDAWIRSSPKAHSEYATRVNQMNNGALKPIVKLLKFWNSQLPSTANLKSFAVETLATRLFERYRADSIQHGLLLFYDFVAFLGGNKPLTHNQNDYCGVSFGYSPTLYDGARISNLLANADSVRIGRFVSNAVIARSRMIESYQVVRAETAWNRVATAIKYY